MPKALLFFVETKTETADTLAEDYPLLQTKALLAILGEIEAWSGQARSLLKPGASCLDAHRDWVDTVENLVQNMVDALEENDKELAACQLDADDPFVESIEIVLDSCPDDDEIRELVRNKPLAEALVFLTTFWTDRLQHLLRQLLTHVTGSAEVFSTIKRQKTLDSLSS